MQNMQNQQLDEFGNPIQQQQPVQAPNPMMPNRAGAPPRSMNDLVYQPMSSQGSMAYQKGGVGSVGNRLSEDALREKIYDDVEKERNKFIDQGGAGGKKGKLMSGEPLKPGHPDYIPPKGKTLSDSTRKKMAEGNYDNEPKKGSAPKPKEMIGKYTFNDFPKEKTPGFSDNKTLSDETLRKLREGDYDNDNKKTSPFLKKEKWMQDLDIEKGGLHKSLGIPMDEKIPYKDKVEASKSSNPKIKKQGVLALNFLKGKQ